MRPGRSAAPVLALAALSSLAALVALAGACGTSGPPPADVSLAPSLVFPQGVLDKVTAVHLQVFDVAAGIDCSMMTATATGVPTGPVTSTKPLAETDLTTTGCTSGSKFCGTLSVTKSAMSDRVFAAVGKDATGAVLANGCARQNVNQDALSLSIKMVRFIPPAMCGDGVIQPTETCDPGMSSDPLCTSCQTAEFLVSVQATYPNGPVPGMLGDKTNPFLVWPAQAGQAGYFYAFYGDKFSGRGQISMRILSDSMATPSAPTPMVAQGGSLFVPNDPNTFPPLAAANDQTAPAAVFAGSGASGKYYVVFQDDSPIGSPANGQDIHLHSMDSSLTVDQAAPGCGINGAMGAGEPGIQASPQVAAGSGGSLLVVWVDQGSGQVNERTYSPGTPCGALGTQQTLSTGTTNAQASVAAVTGGWVVAWNTGSSISWRMIGSDGTPMGAASPPLGSAQPSHPSVAALADGAFAVAWADSSMNGVSAIFTQRYKAGGAPITGDALAKVNDLTSTAEINPVIAATATTSGGTSAYVVAWMDSTAPNHVRARLMYGETGSLMDGSGYTFNTLDGSTSEFQVTTASPSGGRANPAVVSGGAGGAYIGFAWEDKGSTPGIVARRFPAPGQ